VPRWILINDFNQNGTNDLNIVNGAGIKFVTILQSGNFGLNTTTPLAQQHTTSSTAATVGQIVQLATSQTADALQVQSSTGTVLMDVDAAGVVQASGYKSSDGSAGWTGTFLNGSGATVTVKNGLITNVA
jgi:hypothetical protein